MIESLCACFNEVFFFLRAEAYHFVYSSHDEKLERELDEKCLCMLTTEYKKLTGNEIMCSEKGEPILAESTLRNAIFEVRKCNSIHRPCGR
jgi:hypothetical protein